jgi:glycosyltransferase involved in cell wall biosynthesis
MRRIAQLIECDGPGGAEQVVAHLAAGLQESGAQSVVFVPARGEGWLARQLSGTGVVIDAFELKTPVSPACARSLAAAFRRHRIDVAHSHEFSMAVYGAWASWLAGVPHVVTMHGSRYYAGRLRRRVALRSALAASKRTVAVSTRLADQMSRDLWIPRARIAMVSNGVRRAPAAPKTLRDELRLSAADRLLVAVGNLYPVKGHTHLIDAMARLAERHSTLHLAICGRGPLGDALAAQARRLGLANRVHLLGLRSDVAASVAAADLFVMPSLSEGLPLALLEAMSAGSAIVATAVGEVGVALEQGAGGVLVEPGDSNALAAAIERLLGDQHLARTLGARAACKAAAEYDVGSMVRHYRSMYDASLSH